MAADALDLAIANADKGGASFSPFSTLLDTMGKSAQVGQQVGLANAFSGGVPTGPDGQPDYNAMANKLYQLGDISNANALSNIGIQRKLLGAALSPVQAPGVTGAAPATGAVPAGGYAQNVAQAESSGNPNAVSTQPGSHATGLYQFQPGTWADVSRAHPELGLTPQGITDPAQQQKAFQAFTADNGSALKNAGIDPSSGNLYLAHFLGAGGATHFLQGMQANPNAPAASLVGPQAVTANRSLFFGQDNQPVSAQQFYTGLTSKVAGGQPQDAPQDGQPANPDAGGNPLIMGKYTVSQASSLADAYMQKAQQLSLSPLTKAAGDAAQQYAQQLRDQIKAVVEPSRNVKDYMAGRNPGESYVDFNARKEGATETSKGIADLTTKQYAEAGKGYQSSQATLYRLGIIDQSIDALGPNWMGAGANLKAGVAKSWNSIAQLLPDNVASKFQIDPNKVATWEDINKQTTNLGFELAKTLGSREAQMIVQQSIASVPGAQQTYLGSKLVSASLRQAAQRQSDYYEFLNQNPGKVGQDVAFNKLHPVQQYVQAAVQDLKNGAQPGPAQQAGQPAQVPGAQGSIAFPPGAAALLKQNPALRGQFDAKYGAGASARILGGG